MPRTKRAITALSVITEIRTKMNLSTITKHPPLVITDAMRSAIMLKAINEICPDYKEKNKIFSKQLLDEISKLAKQFERELRAGFKTFEDLDMAELEVPFTPTNTRREQKRKQLKRS